MKVTQKKAGEVTCGIKSLVMELPSLTASMKGGVHSFSNQRDGLRFLSLQLLREATRVDPDLPAEAKVAAVKAIDVELNALLGRPEKVVGQAPAAEGPC